MIMLNYDYSSGTIYRGFGSIQQTDDIPLMFAYDEDAQEKAEDQKLKIKGHEPADQRQGCKGHDRAS